MEEERPCAVAFEWCRHDDVNENNIKEFFEYAKSVPFHYVGVEFVVSDYEVYISLSLGDEEKENAISLDRLEDESNFKMFYDAIGIARKQLEKFDVFDAMRNRKLYITVKELTVVFAKIIRAIDNNSNEEYKVYSRKLQNTFKI